MTSVVRCVASRNKRGQRTALFESGLSGPKPAGPRATLVAGLRWGRLRPARLYEPQKHALFNHSNSARFVLGARPRAANTSPSLRRRFYESRYSLSVLAVRRQRGRNRACKGCENAIDLAGRSLRGPKATSVAGLRCGRLRPARPKGSQEHSPKLAPVLRPVSASLRLRLRSAAAVARGNSCRIGRVPTGRICPLRRATDVCAKFVVRAPARFIYIRLSPK